MRYRQTLPQTSNEVPSHAASAARASWGDAELLRSLEPKAVAAVAQAQKVKQ